MIGAYGEEVLIRHPLPRKSENTRIAVSQQPSIGERIKRQVSRHYRIHGDSARRKDPAPGGRRRHGHDIGHSGRLADGLVISKHERSVFYQRPASGCPELIPAERRWRGLVEEVAGVQRAVPKKFVYGPMHRVRTGASSGVDYS